VRLRESQLGLARVGVAKGEGRVGEGWRRVRLRESQLGRLPPCPADELTTSLLTITVHHRTYQLLLILPHAQPVRERREDLERLSRDGQPLVLRHMLQRAHIVQPVLYT